METSQKGFVKYVILIVVALLIAQFYFEIDIYGWLISWRPLIDQYIVQPVASLFGW